VLYRYGRDSAGRVSAVTGSKPGETAVSYVSNVHYAAHDAIDLLTMDAGRYEKTCYDARLAVTGILLRTAATTPPGPDDPCDETTGNAAVLRLQYAASGSNNGNLTGIEVGDGGSWFVSQAYSYDKLNRLHTAAEGSQSTGWKYTRFQVALREVDFIGSLGEKPVAYRSSFQIPGRRRPVRHVVLLSKDLFETTLGANGEARKTVLFDDGADFVLHRLSVRFGLPVLPAWASWFREELARRSLVEPLLGFNCSPLAVKGTKLRLLRVLAQGLRRKRIQVPDSEELPLV
jgi:hypothetical protein